ncbi:MAG: hypothetical protein IT349_02840 [Candidatus Eisenbacteria bacterium]|nr:hypothetical protein [Candidatus Eisenbacteria bacterium]MCC7141015.1 hypothetical protein [Candidatus Eisenbacteria bacterium]
MRPGTDLPGRGGRGSRAGAVTVGLGVIVVALAVVGGSEWTLDIRNESVPSSDSYRTENEGEEFMAELTGAGAMAAQRAAQRGATGAIPRNVLWETKQLLDAIPGSRDGGIWNWEWLGPGNIGGRIRSILPHPTNANRLWIGSASGGIWTTTNAGVSWSPVNDFLPCLAVTSIVLDPTNPNVLYAATGEGVFSTGIANATAAEGAGVFRSSDAGVSWTQLAATVDWVFTNRLVHHPTLANRLWAVTSNPSGVWRSTDGGTAWELQATPDAAAVQIVVSASNPNLLFVGLVPSGGNQGGVWRSTDGGSQWVDLSTSATNDLPDDSGRCEVAIGPANTVYVAIDRNDGEVWRSTSSGAPGSWSRVSTNLDLFGAQGWYDNCIWVDPTNAERLVVGGIDLHRSTDHGTTWTRVSNSNFTLGLCPHPDQHALVAATGFDGVTNRTLYVGNDGGLYRATNIFTASTTSGWTTLNNNLGITQFYSVASSANGGVIVGGTQDNGLPYRTAGGTTWNITPLFLDGTSCAVDPTDANVVYGVTQYGEVWKSTNGGASYASATTGLLWGSGTTLFNAPFEIDPNVPSTVWTGGAQIWKSTNSAGTWVAQNNVLSGTPSVSAISVKPGNSSEVWVGYTDGSVLRTINGGSNWTRVDNGSPALPDRWVMDIEASPHFANEALVVLAGYATQQIWATFNGGTNWSDRSGSGDLALPAIQMNAISYHPANIDWLYVGSDLGIFASNDLGQSWGVAPRFAENDGPAYVEIDDLVWYQDRLLAASWGRGIFRARPLSVVYVDLTNVGTEDGSSAHPYNTVHEGIAASGNGTTLSVRFGTYVEGSTLFDRAGLIVATGGAVTVR